MMHNTKDDIKGLLAKFMDGTTTLEEEDALARYFRGENVPQEWEDYRLMFQELEAMKPAEEATETAIVTELRPAAKRRWIGWGVAAAVVAGLLYVVIPKGQDGQTETATLVAKTDSTVTVEKEPSPAVLAVDSIPKPEQRLEPAPTKKRSLRKKEPTMTDIDKTYTLLAQAEQEQEEAERQMAQAQQEVVKAQLASYGYMPVMQEDGTIIYINEQTEFIAYEE